MPRKAAVLSGAVDAEKGAAHAYVVMRDAAGLSAALAANMSQVEGRHIRVDRAAAPASKTGTTGEAQWRRRLVQPRGTLESFCCELASMCFSYCGSALQPG